MLTWYDLLGLEAGAPAATTTTLLIGALLCAVIGAVAVTRQQRGSGPA